MEEKRLIFNGSLQQINKILFWSNVKRWSNFFLLKRNFQFFYNRLFLVDTTSCNPHFCERPEDISDGSYALSNEDTRFGAAVKYTCDPGYEMTTDSHSTLFCTEEKTWGHHSLPRCIAKDCGLIRCPEKG